MSNISTPVVVVGAVILIVGLFYVVTQYTSWAPSPQFSGSPPAQQVDPEKVPVVGVVTAKGASSISIRVGEDILTFAIDADTKTRAMAGETTTFEAFGVGATIGIFSRKQGDGSMTAIFVDVLQVPLPSGE